MPKTKSQKEDLLQKYDQIISEGNFVLLKNKTIPANNLNEIRKKLLVNNSNFSIIKNSLFKKALKKAKIMEDKELVGNYVVLKGGNDITQNLKIVDQFKKIIRDDLQLNSKDPDSLINYQAYEWDCAYVQGQEIDKTGVQRLLTLPSYNVLLAQFMSLLNAPLTGFMNVINGNQRKLVYALKSISEKK